MAQQLAISGQTTPFAGKESSENRADRPRPNGDRKSPAQGKMADTGMRDSQARIAPKPDPFHLSSCT